MTTYQQKVRKFSAYLSPFRENFADVVCAVDAFNGHVFKLLRIYVFLRNFLGDVDSASVCRKLSDMHDANHLYSSIVGKYRGRVPTLDDSYLQTPVS